MKTIALITLAMTILGTVAPAMAAPEEIQVYLDEFTEPGKFGLDFHTNYVPSAQPGSITKGMSRVTPELSYGINDNWEAALYALSSAGPLQAQGRPVSDGIKLRAKWRPRAPSLDSPWYGAINVEVGQLSNRFFADQTGGEIKFIGMYTNGPWVFGANLNLDRALRRNAQQPTTFEIDTKASYRLRPEDQGDVRIGVENYAFLGPWAKPIGPSTRSNSTYAVADFAVKGWDFNVGVGKASGATGDRWVLKAIIGVPMTLLGG